MKRTANYDLPTWEQDDAIRMKDFNDLTGKLDAALKSGADANASASAALTALLADVGSGGHNCRAIAGSYTGNGGTQTVDLGFKPRFLVISRGFDKGDYSADYALFAGTPEQIDSWMAKVVSITDTGFTVKMATYNTSTCPQLWLNTSGKTYSYIAFR